MQSVLVLLTGLILLCGAASAADFPQWRGPARDGVSPEKALLNAWPAGGPRLLWQRNDLGSGYSTPAVSGDRVLVINNLGLDDERVQAYFLRDGRPLWSTTIGKVGNPGQQPSYPASRSTPTVDGKLLYALGSDGDLACLELESGRMLWKRQLRREFGGQPGEWAYSESPLVDGDRLVCTPGGPEATLLALNKRTGEVVWKSAIANEQAAYSSAVIAELAGVRLYVQMLQRGLVGVDAITGRLLWRYDRIARGSPANIPTPIVGNGMVYAGAGRGGAALLRLRSQDGGVSADEVYYSQRLPAGIGGAVRVGDHLYGTGPSGLMCVDYATGEVKWQDRCVGAGSVLCADGRLYVHGENGEMALVDAAPDAYRERGRFTPAGAPERGRSRAWAYPVIAHGRLLIRDMGVLWCYDVRSGG